MAPKVLFIGLGNMGRGMCKNIVEKGPQQAPLMIYNRSPQRSHDLCANLGASKTEVVDRLEVGVAAADIIFTCLANDMAVEETLKIATSVNVSGKLFIDCSTVHPDTTEKLSKVVLSQGAEFVAAPVFGAPAMAESGQLIGVLAGPKESVNKAKAFFKGVTSRAEVDMSDKPYRNSTTLKIIGNTFVLGMVETLAEGHVLAEKTGLGSDVLHAWLEQMFPGPYVAYSKRMITGDYYEREEPLFAVDLARKDAGHALALAKSVGAQMPNVETADEHLKAVKAHEGEKGDFAGIYGAVRQEGGLKFENQS